MFLQECAIVNMVDDKNDREPGPRLDINHCKPGGFN